MAGNNKTALDRKISSSSDGLDGNTEDIMARGVEREEVDADKRRREMNLKLANPLGGYNMTQLANLGEQYCRENSLGEEEDIRAFRLGAQVAKDPLKFEQVAGLSEEEKTIFADEIANKWRQPKKLYLVILLCSLCAAVQGMG
jgi:hypothetical protein